MKIKLSKSQWEFVGKKAGWIKKCSYDQDYTYLDALRDDKDEEWREMMNEAMDSNTIYKAIIDEMNVWKRKVAKMIPDVNMRSASFNDLLLYFHLNLRNNKFFDDDISKAIKMLGISVKNAHTVDELNIIEYVDNNIDKFNNIYDNLKEEVEENLKYSIEVQDTYNYDRIHRNRT